MKNEKVKITIEVEVPDDISLDDIGTDLQDHLTFSYDLDDAEVTIATMA